MTVPGAIGWSYATDLCIMRLHVVRGPDPLSMDCSRIAPARTLRTIYEYEHLDGSSNSYDPARTCTMWQHDPVSKFHVDGKAEQTDVSLTGHVKPGQPPLGSGRICPKEVSIDL